MTPEQTLTGEIRSRLLRPGIPSERASDLIEDILPRAADLVGGALQHLLRQILSPRTTDITIEWHRRTLSTQAVFLRAAGDTQVRVQGHHLNEEAMSGLIGGLLSGVVANVTPQLDELVETHLREGGHGVQR